MLIAFYLLHAAIPAIILFIEHFIYRSDIQEGDKFIVRNIKKDKRLPNTKSQPNYLGPFTAKNLTKSHLVTEVRQKSVSYPIHISKKYTQREEQVFSSNEQSCNIYIGLYYRQAHFACFRCAVCGHCVRRVTQ